MPLGVESTQIRDFAIDHVKDNNLYIDEPGGEEGQGANLLFTYRVSYKNQDLAELHPELLAVYNKSNTAFPQRLQSAFNNLNRAAMKADPLYVDKSPFFKAPKRGTIAAASTFTVQSANATSDAPVPPPTPSNNTAPALVPPPTPGASTSTEMIPSTPTAPSTPAPTEWQSAMKDVAGLIGSVTKMNADEFAKIRAQREEDRQLALERDAKRQEADEKRWNEADERDAKREEQREEERKEEREAREELREATSTVLKGVDQANAKGDFAIGLGKLAVEQSEYAVKQSNFAVEQVERFEERLQTEVAASVRKQMKGRLNMQHEEEEEEDDDDDDEEEEYNNAKELFKPLVKDDPVLIKMTEDSTDSDDGASTSSSDETDGARSFVADEDDDTPSQDSEEDPQKNTTSDETGDDPQGKRKSNDAAVELNSLTPSNEDAVNEIVDASTKATVPSKMSFFKDWALSFIDFLVDDSSFSMRKVVTFIFGVIFGVIFGAIVALVALAVGFPFASSALVISWSILCAILGGSIFVYWL